MADRFVRLVDVVAASIAAIVVGYGLFAFTGGHAGVVADGLGDAPTGVVTDYLPDNPE